jgi:hypothetical protein
MKTKKQRGAEAPGHEQVRANLRIGATAYRRLCVASLMEGRSAGEIVTRLIEDHLRRWSMPGDLSARGKSVSRDVELDRQSSDGEISLNVADMAA